MIRILHILLFTVALYPFAYAQADDKVDVFIKVSNTGENGNCREFTLGSPVRSVTPVYPPEARSRRLGGAVKVELRVNNEGEVAEILSISEQGLLADAARDAALKTKFDPSRCGNRPVESSGTLIFNFVPLALGDLYTVPARISGFRDIDKQSPYYESVLTLTENYNLAFGYADGNFHPETPLTKGDFAHFLRLTLDLLQRRAEVSRKIPLEIDLYFPLNPLGLRTSAEIIDIDSRRPYHQSVSFLISKYNIALTDENRAFKGANEMNRIDVIGYWEKIFGIEAVPVNFVGSEDPGRAMTRGEFALFLHESLYVLTYKVLP